MLTLTTMVAALAIQTPWAAVEKVFLDSNRPVLYEWYEDTSASLAQRLKDEPIDDWLKRNASPLDRHAIVTDDYVVYQSKWAPPMLRFFDVLTDWSGQQRSPSKGSVSRTKEDHWTIKLKPGETLSLRTLNAQFGLKLQEAPYCLYDARFIVRCENAPTKVLLKAILADLGGKLKEDEAPWRLQIDAPAFRARRLRQASEHLRRNPNELTSITYSLRIEAEALPVMKDKEIEWTYSMLNRPHLMIEVKPKSALLRVVEEKLAMALRAMTEADKKKLVPQQDAPLMAWASTTGSFGGVVYVEDGLPWYF
ncbi:MAG: hypothetical protein WAO58_04370 [Fimbriimonadaceae bacterium]